MIQLRNVGTGRIPGPIGDRRDVEIEWVRS